MMTKRSEFPVLDSDRQGAADHCVRTVFDVFPPLEPRVAELDTPVAMPLRLAHSDSAGWYLEVDLNAADIRHLKAAIAAYDAATGTPQQ